MCLPSHRIRYVVVAENDDVLWQFFDFHTADLEETLVLPSAAVSVVFHNDSGLLAIIHDDLVVRVIDIETRRMVREFSGFRSRVLDLVSIAFLCDHSSLIVYCDFLLLDVLS